MTKKIYLLWHARDITCPTSTFLDRQISSLACQVCHLCLYRSSRRRIQFLAHPGPPEKMPPPKLPGHTAPVLVEMPRAPPPSIHPDLQARSPRSPHFRLLIPPPA